MSVKNKKLFFNYLTKVLEVEHGFPPCYLPGTEPLAKASDVVLAKFDGMVMSIICLVNAEVDPTRRFLMGKKNVKEIANVVRQNYSGSMNGVKLGARIEVIEIRRGHSIDDLERLKALESRLGAIVRSYTMDVETERVFGSGTFYWGMKKLLQKILTLPQLDEEHLLPVVPSVWPEVIGRPWLTYSLISILLAIFSLEIFKSQNSYFAPDNGTLFAMGALNKSAVLESGEWYRVIIAVFLHANWLHLLLNGYALWMAGVILEPLVGRGRLFSLFIVGAIGGSLGSMVFHPLGLSVGASGAIMALFAAAYVISFRLNDAAERGVLQINLLRILIPSLIPIATTHVGGSVDYGAHFGGALMGALCGWVIRTNWSNQERQAPYGRFAHVFSLVGLVVMLICAQRVYSKYQWVDLHPKLVEEKQLLDSKNLVEIASKGPDLLKNYPRDPRAHLYIAMAEINRHDLVKAESEIRLALSEKIILELYFNPAFKIYLQTVLAETLFDEGRINDAKKEAKTPCLKGSDFEKQNLRNSGLCD